MGKADPNKDPKSATALRALRVLEILGEARVAGRRGGGRAAASAPIAAPPIAC